MLDRGEHHTPIIVELVVQVQGFFFNGLIPFIVVSVWFTQPPFRVPYFPHIAALLRATFRQDVHVGDICEGLISKAESKSSSWTAVVKALTVLHRLLQDGHEVRQCQATIAVTVAS